MRIALVIATLLCVPQDSKGPEEKYREALYQEIDRGDLAAAIKLYATIERDQKASEQLVAKALFRRAWCLEKQGKKVEAERSYRDVLRRHPEQKEIVAQAKERADHILARDGITSPSDFLQSRITDLVYDIASETNWPQRPNAMRKLFLFGDAAVPALKRALSHKDPLLSASAACVLVDLEEDTGTYPVIMRALLAGSWSQPTSDDLLSHVVKLIKLRESVRESFQKGFLAAQTVDQLWRHLEVLERIQLPDLADHLREVFLNGPIEVNLSAANAIDNDNEDYWLDMLKALDSDDPHAQRRAENLLLNFPSPVRNHKDLMSATAKLFPQPMQDFRNVHSHRQKYILDSLVPRHVWVAHLAPSWLRTEDKSTLSAFFIFLNEPTRTGSYPDARIDKSLVLPILCDVLGEPADRLGRFAPITEYRLFKLIHHFLQIPQSKELRSQAKKALKHMFRSKQTSDDYRDEVLPPLLEVLEETDPEWDFFVRNAIELYDVHFDQPDRRSGLNWSDPKVRYLEEFFNGLSTRGQERFRGVLQKSFLEGTNKRQRHVLPVIAKYGGDSLISALEQIALDPRRPLGLRKEIIEQLGSKHSGKSIRVLGKLLKEDATAEIRRMAIYMLRKIDHPDVLGLLEAAARDADDEIRRRAVIFFRERSDEQAERVLLKALKDQNPGIRAEAVSGIRSLASVKAVPMLIELLADKDPVTRSSARGALDEIRKHYEEIEEWKAWHKKVTEGKDK